MILYIENPKDTIKNQLELNKYSKDELTDTKLTYRKPLFLNTNNTLSQKEINETIPFTIV